MVNIRQVIGNQHWFMSTLKWLQKHNLNVGRGSTEVSTISINTNKIRAMPRLPRGKLKQLEKYKITHIWDIIDDSSGDRQWRLPSYSWEYIGDLPDKPPAGTELMLWPGHYWRLARTITTANGRLSKATVMKVISIDQKNGKVVIKC